MGLGGLYQTTDGGTTWQNRELPIPEAYKSHALNIYPPKFFAASRAILPVTFVPTGRRSTPKMVGVTGRLIPHRVHLRMRNSSSS